MNQNCLEERFVSLGACWAFSFQPVLPSVWRPVVLLLQNRTRAKAINAVSPATAVAGAFAQQLFLLVHGDSLHKTGETLPCMTTVST